MSVPPAAPPHASSGPEDGGAPDRHRVLIEASPEAAYVIRDGRFEYLNPAAVRLFGAPDAAALLGMPVLDRVHPDDQPLAVARRRLVLEGPGLAPLAELRFVTLDGRILPVEVHASAVEFDGQRAIFATARDVSHRKRLEEQVLQSQKLEAVGRLAGGVAHDFNNTLAVILGHAEFALAALPADAPLRGDLEAIRRAAEHSAALTRQLLAYARRQPIAPRGLDLNAAVEATMRMLRPLIGESVDLLWSPAPDLWPVTLDPAQLDQILTNLCANARDAIDGVGTLEITTANRVLDATAAGTIQEAEPGEYVLLSVSDTGRGMAADLLARAFEPFFTTKGIGEGTGLGLSTVYGIVRQNHGTVTVRSEPGVGTRFELYFPRRLEAVEPTPPVEAAPAAPAGTETVLVVEDEPAILQLAARALRAQGYEVLAAGGAEAALAAARAHGGRLDLLVTDVMMPGMSGPDLARALVADRPQLRVVYMSGFSADLVARHGRLDPGTEFLAKPFTLGELATRVRRVLDRAAPPAPSAPRAASRSSAA